MSWNPRRVGRALPGRVAPLACVSAIVAITGAASADVVPGNTGPFNAPSGLTTGAFEEILGPAGEILTADPIVFGPAHDDLAPHGELPRMPLPGPGLSDDHDKDAPIRAHSDVPDLPDSGGDKDSFTTIPSPGVLPLLALALLPRRRR